MNGSIKYHCNLPWYFNTRNNRYFYDIDSILPLYLNPRKSKVFSAVIYHGKLLQYF